MYKILTLNNISVVGLEQLPRDRYEIASEIGHPDAILVRSFAMHDLEIPETVKAIGRAGAGVNNIPVDKMSQRGVPVFNAPGANANAVKELVVAGMLLASRNICQAWQYVRELKADKSEMNKLVEAGKKKYVGFELPGRTLGVIGLGAIGREVANVALSLGMNVIGYDPGITVQGAWKLSSNVSQAASVDDLLARADYITFHVPLIESTKNLINEERIKLLKQNSVILNFARGGIVDDNVVLSALDSGKLYSYVCDFPSPEINGHPRVIALPHLGASTNEAEDNCASMVSRSIKEYLENGNVINSVNFPEVYMNRAEQGVRLCVVNANVPNMVGQISTAVAKANLNICDLLNKSKGDLAYTLLDMDADVPDSVIADISAIDGVMAVRKL